MPHPRVIKAFDAMEALGISKKEVKPVLKNLFKLYDNKWELIEDDNYRALIDAYFESKEDKVSLKTFAGLYFISTLISFFFP
jgi:hypothetical protein